MSKKIAVFFILIVAFLWFTPWVFILKFPISINATYFDKTKSPVLVKVGPKEATWVSIKKASRYAVSAIVVSEDSRFYDHDGLDFVEIEKSFKLNSKKGHYARGASTITQQVVRLAFLEREKSILRKTREALGAVLLELIMSKEEILEWYINLADFGNGKAGLKEASRVYFSTRPELLTISQGVQLALVLPNPHNWSKSLHRRNLTTFGHKRFAKILRFLLQNGYITKKQWEQTMASGNFGAPILYGKPLRPKITKPETELDTEQVATETKIETELETKEDSEIEMNLDMEQDTEQDTEIDDAPSP